MLQEQLVIKMKTKQVSETFKRTSTMKGYRYTGSIAALIPHGYKFHKLYARNYRAYNKGPIWMFPISKMIIEIDNCNLQEHIIAVKFILDNLHKADRFFTYSITLPLFGKTTMPRWLIIEGQLFTKKAARAKYGINSHFMHKFPIDLSLVQQIRELYLLGGIKWYA
jgi:hypothetical protein